MEVCDVCGAFLVTHDASDRLESHYKGKQHQGFLKIREALNEKKQTQPQSSPYPNQSRPHTNYSRQRYEYNDRREGGRHREYRRYSDRERRDRYHHGRNRRDNDDFAGAIESYSRHSRRDQDEFSPRSPAGNYRSRSPAGSYRSRSPGAKHRSRSPVVKYRHD
ncbi:hypothetical protein G6F56_012452 [Rhizopus delemar]|nr:hypothetical protein G6F56_012452 [Rhizopus delemar]